MTIRLRAREPVGLQNHTARGVEHQPSTVVGAVLRAEHQLHLPTAATLIVRVLGPTMPTDEATVQLCHEVLVEHAPQVRHIGKRSAIAGADDATIHSHRIQFVVAAKRA